MSLFLPSNCNNNSGITDRIVCRTNLHKFLAYFIISRHRSAGKRCSSGNDSGMRPDYRPTYSRESQIFPYSLDRSVDYLFSDWRFYERRRRWWSSMRATAREFPIRCVLADIRVSSTPIRGVSLRQFPARLLRHAYTRLYRKGAVSFRVYPSRMHTNAMQTMRKCIHNTLPRTSLRDCTYIHIYAGVYDKHTYMRKTAYTCRDVHSTCTLSLCVRISVAYTQRIVWLRRV